MKFSEFAEINPTIRLDRSQEYDFVEMADIHTGNRFVRPKIKKLPKGGAKFQNNDTLFARITPCLENGKIAQVRNIKTDAGFGSTEFYVFRGKEGISDSGFVYYLSQTEIIRGPAEKSMTGASGRQRADIAAIKDIDIPNIDLVTQRKVASILSNYDFLIENNNHRISILEDIAQSLYQEWFVKFRYPGHQNTKFKESSLGLIPEGWEVKSLDEIATINPENISNQNKPESIGYIDIKSVGTGIINEVRPMQFIVAPSRARRIVADGDIIWATVRPNRKQYSYICKPVENTVASTGFAVLRSQKVPSSYLYFNTTTDSFTSYLVNHATGSAYPAVNANIFEKAGVLLPSKELLKSFDEIAGNTIHQCDVLKKKNDNLKKQRDLLLPKLISGTIFIN